MKKVDIKKQCEKLIGLPVTYVAEIDQTFYGKIKRIRIEVEEAETGASTLVSPNSMEFCEWEK